MAPPPPTPAFALPAQPNDPNVTLTPVYSPPTVDNVHGDEGSCRDHVEASLSEGPAVVPNDSCDYALVTQAAATVPQREDVAHLWWQAVSRQLCDVIRDTFRQEGQQLCAEVDQIYEEENQKDREVEQKFFDKADEICEDLEKVCRKVQQVRGRVQRVNATAQVVGAQARQLCVELERTYTTLCRTRGETLPGRVTQTNLRRKPLEIVLFVNGDDPTGRPHNLPCLVSANAIDNLRGRDIIKYLNGYGIDPLPVGRNTCDTNRLRKETLKWLVGAPF